MSCVHICPADLPVCHPGNKTDTELFGKNIFALRSSCSQEKSWSNEFVSADLLSLEILDKIRHFADFCVSFITVSTVAPMRLHEQVGRCLASLG